MYILKRRGDGLYVSKPGNHHSYVRSIMNARKYSTREAAKGDACIENEYVVSVDDETH